MKKACQEFLNRGRTGRIGSLSNHEGNGENSVDKKVIFYLRISLYSEVIYFVYNRQNYHKTKPGTQR